MQTNGLRETLTPLKIWRLRAKADQRFRSGHPWVYSNELQESPKGIEPGAPVELQDAGGKFLARGYGNPNSLIAFRALSRDPSIARPDSPEEIVKALVSASQLREQAGLMEFSHRLCFGEADSLPGMIIDRYRTGEQTQVFAVQLHTAGMDRLQPHLLTILKALVEKQSTRITWENTAVVLDNEISARKLEGVPQESPRVLKDAPGVNLEHAKIRVAPALSTSASSAKLSTPIFVEFETDLLGGQKTGFFLDQAANIQLAAERLKSIRSATKAVRILDLCCYVGQWATQLTRVFREQGLEVEVTVVDASASALEHAKSNVEREGAQCQALKADVLTGLGVIADQSFDLVICDPPALIKSRKDIPTGTHAYLQLNTQVFRIVRRGGFVVSCSCSGLLEEESFLKVLSKAAYRNRVPVRWIARGTQAPDHPMRIEFPEGRYLKAWIGYVG
jgi:23S rRNA (cytosine1962-C5)-methyltransferase